jgi:hypothetical protein
VGVEKMVDRPWKTLYIEEKSSKKWGLFCDRERKRNKKL